MIECPQCSAVVDGLVCQRCGYAEDGVIPAGGDAAMYDWKCAHIDRGQRCANLGTRSQTTMNRGSTGKGPNGPWYCRLHDPQSRLPSVTERAPPPQGFQVLKDILASGFGLGAKDPLKWARDIMADMRAGKRLLPIQVEFAQAALRGKAETKPDRQPGEDDA